MKARFYCDECQDSGEINGKGCQECCEHEELDHFICIHCEKELDPGIFIDRAMDAFEE